MRLLDDVRLIESVIFAPPTISIRARPSQALALDRSIVKLVTMEDDAVLLPESIIRGNHGQKSSRSFRANRFDVDLSADVTVLDLNLALLRISQRTNASHA